MKVDKVKEVLIVSPGTEGVDTSVLLCKIFVLSYVTNFLCTLYLFGLESE